MISEIAKFCDFLPFLGGVAIGFSDFGVMVPRVSGLVGDILNKMAGRYGILPNILRNTRQL